ITVGDATAGRGGADEKHRRSAPERVLDARYHRYPRSGADVLSRILPRPRRVDDCDHLERRVPEHSYRGLRGGARELALGEDRDLHRPPTSRRSRRKRPCRSRAVSPDSSATPPFTMTYSIPIG